MQNTPIIDLTEHTCDRCASAIIPGCEILIAEIDEIGYCTMISPIERLCSDCYILTWDIYIQLITESKEAAG